MTAPDPSGGLQLLSDLAGSSCGAGGSLIRQAFQVASKTHMGAGSLSPHVEYWTRPTADGSLGSQKEAALIAHASSRLLSMALLIAQQAQPLLEADGERFATPGSRLFGMTQYPTDGEPS